MIHTAIVRTIAPAAISGGNLNSAPDGTIRGSVAIAPHGGKYSFTLHTANSITAQAAAADTVSGREQIF